MEPRAYDLKPSSHPVKPHHFIPILHLRKLRLTVVKKLAQSHGHIWQRANSNSDLYSTKSMLSTLYHYPSP